MKHYDCHNQNLKLEQFYGASTQLELLRGITRWWFDIYINNDDAIIDAIKITFSEDADPDEGYWCAGVYWSK